MDSLAIAHDFYPRPPRGGRLQAPRARRPQPTQFLSTPSARRATGPSCTHGSRDTFLSTPSARRATLPCQFAVSSRRISIHALREEGDAVTNVNRTHVKDFYPRPPRGGRRLWHSGTKAGRDFYPRPPRGGRLSVLYRPSGRWRISIHALREEGDRWTAAAAW